MPDETQDDKEHSRSASSTRLMIAAALLLLLPLLGAAYILFFKSGSRSTAPSGQSVFQRRAGPSPTTMPLGMTATPIGDQKSLMQPLPDSGATEASGSLGFVRGGTEYSAMAEKKKAPTSESFDKAEKVAPAAPAIQAAPAPAARPAAKSAARAAAPRPKLKPSGKGTFAGSRFGAGKEQQAPPEAPDIGALLKAAGAGGEDVDINALMKAAPAGAAAPAGDTKRR